MIRSRRNAFSLIELLVVIALLSVLAALSAGAYFRVRSAQIVNASQATLSKLNTGLDRIWSAERDRADKEFSTGQLIGNASKANIIGFAGTNNTDRARAIWLYFRLKNEFPQTFPEAVSYTTLSTTPTANPIFSLPPKQTFLMAITGSPSAPSASTVNSLAPATADAANLQAAALLYLILSEKGSRGELFDADSLKAQIVQVTINGMPFRVFTDAWGTPITYVRFLTNAEIDSSPYSRNSTTLFGNSNNLPAGISNNPIDITASLTSAGWSNFPAFCSSAGIVPSIGTGAPFQEQLLRRNFIATAISAGPDKTFTVYQKPLANPPIVDVNATLNPTYPYASPYANIGIVEHGALSSIEGDDNLYGYRLRQFGARSD